MNTTRNQSAFPLFEEGVRGRLFRGSLLLLLALFATLSLNAQMLKVYKGGTMVYCLENADSVVFCSVSDKPLSGTFSVSATKQVRFSKGNLQYTQSTQTWSFAEHQYDMLGTDNVEGGTVESFEYYYKNGSTLADKIDLFGWSGSTGSAKWGISTSLPQSDYSGDFVDWGTNIGDGQTWYTLTYDEWYYLRWNRINADNLVGVARINLNTDGTEYANGLILLPDNWTCPAGVTFKSGFASKNSVQAYAYHQTFTLSDWQLLESAGAVFLPASGFREGASVSFVPFFGLYWSATPNNSDYAYEFYFGSDEATSYNDWGRDYGFAVRLVRDL